MKGAESGPVVLSFIFTHNIFVKERRQIAPAGKRNFDRPGTVRRLLRRRNCLRRNFLQYIDVFRMLKTAEQITPVHFESGKAGSLALQKTQKWNSARPGKITGRDEDHNEQHPKLRIPA